MKKYVFFAYATSTMGGSQMYLRNKSLFLQKEGWSVQIIARHTSPVLISDFKKMNTHEVSAIIYPIYYFSSSYRTKLIEKILLLIDAQEGDEIIIESNSIGFACWGEFIASKIKAKHIIFFLDESNTIEDSKLFDFFEYKLTRNELFGIKMDTLKNVLKDENKKNSVNAEQHILRAYCTNVVTDYSNPVIDNILKQKQDGFSVLSLGRLDKPYIKKMINDLFLYTTNHTDMKFNFIFIGDSTSVIKKNEAIFQNAFNVKLFFTGNVYPIPQNLFQSIDLCIASSGSARVCQQEGIPTIAIDVNDFMPLGILGETTKNVLFRDKEPQLPLSSWIDDVIIKKKYKRKQRIDSDNYDFTNHLKILDSSNNKYDYFNVLEIIPESKKRKLIVCFFSLFGDKNTMKLMSFFNHFFK